MKRSSKYVGLDVHQATTVSTVWLDTNRAVEQMTWAPGERMVIADRLIAEGGWIERPGCRCFNLYREPQIAPGHTGKAGPWLDHLHVVYPDAAAHIVAWLAHRVQRPGEKLNHALILGGKQGIGKDSRVRSLRVRRQSPTAEEFVYSEREIVVTGLAAPESEPAAPAT